MTQLNVLDRMLDTVQSASTAIVLTHNIDFLFVESILLPRLRKIGSPHLTIFADAACAANSFHAQERLVTRLGSRYRVVPVELGSARRFHPKAIFLCGQERAALAVGSGNTTHGGWSANLEIWSDFAFPGAGGGEIAAFRAYLERILTYVPDPTPLRASTTAAFSDGKSPWTKILPQPSGLASTPSSTALLDQIVSFVGRDIVSFDVLSPYFDPQGEALRRLTVLASDGVNILLQPNRVGLSADVAASLPSTIRLQSIEPSEAKQRHKFIHAKSYVIRSAGGIVLATGSANCSQAALLAPQDWGNAELMALARVDEGEVASVWDGFSITATPPALPNAPPSDEWEIETRELRILGARKEGAHLQVHYKSAIALTQMFIRTSASDATPVQARSFTEAVAKFSVAGTFASLVLHGMTADGAELVSSPSWVDDERALRMAAPERMLRDKLEDAAALGSVTGAEFLQILELFELHTQKQSNVGGGGKLSNPEADAVPIPFTEADIYSDGFGKPTALHNPATAAEFDDADTMDLFLSFFKTRQEDGGGQRRPQPAPKDDENKDDADNKPDAVKAAESKVEHATLGPKVLKLLAKIQHAMSRPEFAFNRTPARLAADIGFISLLMTKARIDGHIGADSYREQSLSFWQVLFFGPDGKSGLVPKHLADLDEADRDHFILEMRSARLTAAMTLWCMIDWNSAAPAARQFRVAAASLGAKNQWLTQGGTSEEILAELDLIATKLLPSQDREDLFKLWVDWVRDSHALASITSALERVGQRALAKLCSRPRLEKGELAWHVGRGFCTFADNYDRRTSTRVSLHPINQSAPLRVQIEFAAPLVELLGADIGVSDGVKDQVFTLAQAIGYDLRMLAP